MPLHRSFYFVRHGETDWNKQLMLQGHTDIPLNDTGRAQAERAIDIVRHLPIDRVIASTLSRADETARILNSVLQKPLSNDSLLVERSFGDFEGKDVSCIDNLKSQMALQGLVAEENGYPCPPNAESYADFKARTLTNIRKHLEAFEGENILFVAHGGLYRVLRRALFGKADTSPNVQPYHFEKADDAWKLHVLTL